MQQKIDYFINVGIRHMKQELTYRKLIAQDMEQASLLAWYTFHKFSTAGCTMRGIEEFKRFVAAEDLKEYRRCGSMYFWGCFDQGILVGFLASTGYDHISLLFVKESHHNRGIARGLFEILKQEYRSHPIKKAGITVNASLYASPIYKRLGFVATDAPTMENGLRYIPMYYEISDSNECK